MDSTRESSRKSKSFQYKSLLRFLPALAGFALPFIVHFDGLSTPGHLCLSIFLAAACLWLFEPVPLFATAVLIFFLEVVLLSEQGIASTLGASGDYTDYAGFLRPLASPLIVLFLGGFVIADAARKHKVDLELARVLLRPFGTNPKMILLGVMLITAVFSAFMSNTACTAMMMAVIFPAIAVLEKGDRYRAAITLAVPFAANIGGMATPIGTPPNAVVIGALESANEGLSIGFIEWVKLAGPFSLLMLALVWLALVLFFPSKAPRVKLALKKTGRASGKKVFVYVIFAVTVLLWITGQWHGIPDGVVALLPVAAFTMFGVLKPKEFNSLSWDILWLIAGGMALGNAMSSTGLTEWMVGLVPWSGLPGWSVMLVFIVATVLLSTFISNTAASNLFVPLAIGVAFSMFESGDGGTLRATVVPLVAMVGLSASLAMALPVSTPPNAIAYATGQIKTRDMATTGIIIGIAGLVLLGALVPFLWKALGLF